MGDIVPHPLWLCSEQFLGEGCVQCGLSAWYARAERCRCLVSPIRLRRFCDAVRGRCWVRRPLPNDSKTLPLRTTGPAAARTSATRRASAKRAGVPSPQKSLLGNEWIHRSKTCGQEQNNLNRMCINQNLHRDELNPKMQFLQHHRGRCKHLVLQLNMLTQIVILRFKCRILITRVLTGRLRIILHGCPVELARPFRRC